MDRNSTPLELKKCLEKWGAVHYNSLNKLNKLLKLNKIN